MQYSPLFAQRQGFAIDADDPGLRMGVHAPDRTDAHVDRVIGRGLATDRAGFGHAIADGDLVHAEPGHHFAHRGQRAGRSGHDPCAQCAGFRLCQRGMIEHADEHGRHAIQRGAAFRLDRIQYRPGIEPVRRIDQRRTAGNCGKVAHHHAETMVQWHRHANPVCRRQVLGPPDEIAVVEDIAMAQRGAFRQAGGAAGELDIHRIVGAQRRAGRIQRGAVGGLRQIVPAQVPRMGLIVQRYHQPQRGYPRRPDVAQHGDIVAGLEPRRRDERAAPDFVQGIFDFAGAIGGVDRHQNGADPRGGKLDHRPLRTIGRPDSHPVAFADAVGQQPGGDPIHLGIELPPGPAQILMP